MTEAEWLAADGRRVVEMVNAAGRAVWSQDPAPARRLLLFACACYRRVWPLLTDSRSRAAVEAVERSADEAVEPDTLTAALYGARVAAADLRSLTPTGSLAERTLAGARADMAGAVPALGWPPASAAVGAAVYAALAVKQWAKSENRPGRPMAQRERNAQVALLRDIVNNPFRRVVLDPSLLTSTVVALASTIYNERDFSLLPILADALQDAGCSDAQILGHCRGGGEHWRGCWVVDLVMGKT